MSGLVYSRWSPSEGGYDYFLSPEMTPNINDDLPNPELISASKIGVPSIEAGRPIPGGATKVGHGKDAHGVIAPVDASRIVRRTRSLGAFDGSSSVDWRSVAIVGVLGIVAYSWYRHRERA